MQKEDTALFEAAYHNKEDVLQTLIRNKANLYAQNEVSYINTLQCYTLCYCIPNEIFITSSAREVCQIK